MAAHRTLRDGFTSRILLFAVYFVCVVLLQWRGNAFRSEFSGSPDEPAHYVTGIMVHDYIAAGFPGPPMPYARSYYLHYPKVALGHWPPFFYVVQAAWTLPFGTSRTSVLLLMAAITALLATILCEVLRDEFSLALGMAAAALFISLPVIEEFSGLVMAEMLVALLVLLAVLAYGRYLDSGRWQPAAWFGIWFALALLTKGTAIQLAILPPFAVLFAGRWHLLRRFTFWLPAILVLGLAGPWYLWVPGAQHESVARFGGVGFNWGRLTGTPVVWAGMLGLVLLIAALVGLLMCCRQMFRGSARGMWIASVAVLLGAYLARLFMAAYRDERHLLVNLPTLLMLAALSVAWCIRQPRWQGLKTGRRNLAVSLALLALLAFNVSQSPQKRHYGFSEVAQDLLSRPALSNSVFLICAGPTGEGMLISEVAARESRPGHIVLRGDKMLASEDWMGRDYKLLFHDADEMSQYLESIPAGIVIIDGEGRRTPHGQLLYRGIQAHPEKWALLSQDPANDILVYRLIGHEGRAVGKIRIPMRAGLYGNFEN
ncbi:MAG TPA: glycosyltransferase family 39 protein [Bryobacteraceae bacterium]|nr:glycosyltransferase family 39 protein [Bryobacteraceae bacterium]